MIQVRVIVQGGVVTGVYSDVLDALTCEVIDLDNDMSEPQAFEVGERAAYIARNWQEVATE